MKKSPFLLRRCDLFGCERMGAFLLSDGRALCDFHALLFMLGDTKIKRWEADIEEEERKNLPDWTPEGPVQ